MKRILIVDDEPNVHYSFKRILADDYEIISAESGEEALTKLEESDPELVIMDIKLPGMTGLQTLEQIKEFDVKLPVIVMTAYGTMNTAIEAMRMGAYEYTLKPFDVPWMKETIEKALASKETMERMVAYPPIGEGEGRGDVIIGNSQEMQKVYKMIGQIAEKDVTVLIRGDSGTGKELFARAIYQHSRRASKPFIAVNCAAIPDTLLESELFGYERGAFTGARERRIGKFEQSDRGTMFLDEIGDMSLSTQTKILRVIQEGEFTRLGGSDLIKVDVRLIVATNRDLEKAIQEGRFREDLYYRLNVISIHLPPLRERKEDIPELVKYFLKKFGQELGKSIRSIDIEAMDKLMQYDWPGNVRELENCLKRAVILAKTSSLSSEDLQIPPDIGVGTRNRRSMEELLEEALNEAFVSENTDVMAKVERILILKALQKTGGNQVRAARLLGISRNTLRNRIEKYGITRKIRIS